MSTLDDMEVEITVSLNLEAATIVEEAIGNSDADNTSEVIIGMSNLIDQLISRLDQYRRSKN